MPALQHRQAPFDRTDPRKSAWHLSYAGALLESTGQATRRLRDAATPSLSGPLGRGHGARERDGREPAGGARSGRHLAPAQGKHCSRQAAPAALVPAVLRIRRG